MNLIQQNRYHAFELLNLIPFNIASKSISRTYLHFFFSHWFVHIVCNILRDQGFHNLDVQFRVGLAFIIYRQITFIHDTIREHNATTTSYYSSITVIYNYKSRKDYAARARNGSVRNTIFGADNPYRRRRFDPKGETKITLQAIKQPNNRHEKSSWRATSCWFQTYSSRETSGALENNRRSHDFSLEYYIFLY